MQLLSADRHFCPQTELAAVGETGAGVNVHRRRVHRTYKVFIAAQRSGEDRIGVVGAVGVDMVDGLIDVIH